MYSSDMLLRFFDLQVFFIANKNFGIRQNKITDSAKIRVLGMDVFAAASVDGGRSVFG